MSEQGGNGLPDAPQRRNYQPGRQHPDLPAGDRPAAATRLLGPWQPVRRQTAAGRIEVGQGARFAKWTNEGDHGGTK
jgi:hypothetical protein